MYLNNLHSSVLRGFGYINVRLELLCTPLAYVVHFYAGVCVCFIRGSESLHVIILIFVYIRDHINWFNPVKLVCLSRFMSFISNIVIFRCLPVLMVEGVFFFLFCIVDIADFVHRHCLIYFMIYTFCAYLFVIFDVIYSVLSDTYLHVT